MTTTRTSSAETSSPPDVSERRALQDEIARLDASIAVLEPIDTLSDRARADRDAQRSRRAELVAALAALSAGSAG
ncbi:MAG: hypothetical protein QOH15_860 [Gaiellales bacterium]|nr:hypothetical protein [Gaiellales bacterium]